ncbi:MAG: FAD-dependent oxidoreductase [Syntrophomonadaceae bacterium]|jgi:electron transfer flavoprotein-quinone oxidoreductase|nr:FAD-dependent oxidoreductase [Syntrophomonadaceae bacterium]
MMAEEDKFDVIVVGAGLSGLAAACAIAKEGLEVLVLERGEYPGAKNVTGGRLYLNPIRDMFADLFAEAPPFERYITNEDVCVMDEDRSVSLSYSGSELREQPYSSYSILRSKFDKWLGKQCERQGAMLVTRSRVDEIIMDNGKVVGVRAGGEELSSDIVIAADGVLSFIAQQAGLRQPFQAGNFAVGCKEIIEIPREQLEARFNLEEDEGLARLYMGAVTKGKFGGGFLYTNKESISLGLVMGIEGLTGALPALEIHQIMENFKRRPEVAKLIKNGESVEYSAHVIPEGGLKSMGKLYGAGILVVGDAAGFSMNIGITVRGMEYALASGYYAAQAVIQAKKNEDYSEAGLAFYKKLLDDSFVMKDFNSFKESLSILENPRLFTYYPQLLGNIMKDLYNVPDGPKTKLYPTVRKHLSNKNLMAMGKDAWRLMKL